MKAIAERYEVAAIERDQKTQLRLMVQPLYRYTDEKQGIIDGAVFSYAAGTNPEVLLLLECRGVDANLSWYAAFARFGANRLEANSGATSVWESPAIQKWDPRESYYSQFGPVDRVFQANEE